MALSELDQNAVQGSTTTKPRPAHESKNSENDPRSAGPASVNSDQGGLFQPESIGNKFSWNADVLHRFEDDEQREGSAPERPLSPRHVDSDFQNGTTNYAANGQENGQPNGQANGHANGHSPALASGLNNESPHTPNVQGQVDSPTWLRKFSKLPSGFASNETWKDWGRALKFGRRRDTLQQQQYSKEYPQDASDEATRMRASNLVTSLLSGAPAAMFLASSFQKDEHGTRRAPLLLSLLSVELQDVTPPGSRHSKYKLYMEYGVGENRLKWTVMKDLRDFISLHSRLKISLFQSKNFKGAKKVDLPKFPRYYKSSNDPVAHTGNQRTLNNKYLSTSVRTANGNGHANYNDTTNPSQHQQRTLRQSSVGSTHSNGSGGFFRDRLHAIASMVSGDDHEGTELQHHLDENARAYRAKLQEYLDQLILTLALRPQSNKLFQFFELSPIGVMLSYETGYQGKQGYLIVGSSSKAQGWRVGHLRASDIKQMVERHTSKWFLVRNSYVMYVSDIYSTTPLDVFLVDSQFKITFSGSEDCDGGDNESFYDDGMSLMSHEGSKFKKRIPHFTIKLENSERELKVISKSENQARLWVHSLQTMQKNAIWSKKQRFGSFAPVRKNCFAQWFVDGRDYMWAVSSAMEMAKDVIYIHDWWLSPELYMRRPANGNQEWRIDRILKRKAEQGVKIFVIIYRNVGSTVVTDSLWTKHSLIDLHPNIHVIRSPNQWLQNTYFWAHHEKLCMIDHTVGFVGGIDLCYGRYDTPDHVLVDDSQFDFASNQSPTENSVKFQTFPGKDYSNPRIKDFYDLDKPYESMYDRQTTPRMPWHDVHMVVAGQPARDLSRHFVQRWNYLLRQKRPSRPTPILTPPPEFNPEDLDRFNLSGSCEVQILRSAGNWSLGLKHTEHSIQSAYLKLIETSEHYIYIENQFFITSSAFDGTVIENRIGDALVDRIIRAHNEKKKWKAFIVIPLMPGFESEVDEAEGSAVRVIMECQYKSISRTGTSIFAKLKKMKINPYDYIQFYSLRKWGRIGEDRKLVSEQLYIHAKILIVDDRTALIGSANINERSQRGNRDSEVAAVVRDTEVVNSTMDDKPYKAARFAHTLRMRLMREHLGVDVDILDIVERRFNKIEELAKKTKTGQGSKTNNFTTKDYEVGSSMVELASRDVLNMPEGTKRWKNFQNSAGATAQGNDEKYNQINKEDAKENLPQHLQEKSHEPVPLLFHSFNNRAREENAGIRDKKQYSSDARITNNQQQHRDDVEGRGADHMDSTSYQKQKIDAAKTLKKWAKESMVNSSTSVFLPNVSQVLEFLDDTELIKNPESLTDEEEIIIAERNQERWDMLKRVAYLQRVAAKYKVQADEENRKRQKTGLSPLFENREHEEPVETVDGVSDSAASNLAAGGVLPEQPTGDTKEPHGEIEDLPGDNIPVISLDSDGIKTLLDSINDSGNPSKFNKLIDPYCFQDPLSESFYEDVWFENAYRNTLLFREVFHCQPDDTVVTWNEYKTFTKLNTAFMLAQDQDASRRMKPTLTNSTDGDRSTLGLPRPRDNSVRTPDFNEMRRDSVLGNVPTESQLREESPDLDASPASTAPKRGKSGAYAFRKRSPLGGVSVFDRETADKLLSEIQGHLVLFPVDWLYKEVEGGNWFYNMDRIPPLEIYD